MNKIYKMEIGCISNVTKANVYAEEIKNKFNLSIDVNNPVKETLGRYTWIFEQELEKNMGLDIVDYLKGLYKQGKIKYASFKEISKSDLAKDNATRDLKNILKENQEKILKDAASVINTWLHED